jgi:hypothetical protein
MYVYVCVDLQVAVHLYTIRQPCLLLLCYCDTCSDDIQVLCVLLLPPKGSVEACHLSPI